LLFKNWKPYEIAWLCLFSLIAVTLTVIWQDSIFGFSVFLTGILCVILAAKGNIWTYVFGAYNTLGYAYIAFTNALYGEMGLNILFFLPMNIVGFFMWRRHMHEGQVQMRKLTPLRFMLVALGCVIGVLAMGFGLSLIPGQNTPYIDATTNVLSIVATILMVRRFREQWLLYIVLNIFTIAMWTIRSINGSPDGAMMIVMWSAYLVNAVYGFIVWNHGARALAQEASA
jgi:nicotinamide mononucleotide transporter